MSKRKILLSGVYTLALVLILWYPVGKILRFEFPAAAPVEIKFKATVYDPYDPMRGRYVRLTVLPYRIETADKKSRFTYSPGGSKGYAVIEKTPSGFAKVLRLEKDPSKIGKGEIAVKVKGIYYNYGWKKTPAAYRFTWPFDRFYLNELKAPELEAELRNNRHPVVLKVRIFPSGDYAVAGLEKP